MNRMPSPMEEYLFDLNGFIQLNAALSRQEVDACNGILDEFPREFTPGSWFGRVHGQKFTDNNGVNLQQIYEAGEPFEVMIDHPSWIEYILKFIGGQGTFDYHHGSVFIDESFASLRGPGEGIGLHSGGHTGCKRTAYGFKNGHFNCSQVNVLVALTDIGPGDGATVVIPGSHKANLPHPELKRQNYNQGIEGEIEGAKEVHMKAGDAILFVDAICHGGLNRINPGERRFVVYRYGPSWGFFRHGYRPSEELLDRLNDERRQIVWPHEKLEVPSAFV